MLQLIGAADGRRLAVEISGDPDGMPVFLMHGTPGSRSGPHPRGIVLYRLGVRLISYDRPGYGRSDRHHGRGVHDAAGDVAAIADALGIDRFGVVGRSGGGPHALACAALLKERVERCAALVSIAPADAEGLDWLDGMGDGNVDEFSSDLAAVTANLAKIASEIREDPEFLLRVHLKKELAAADRRVVDDIAIRRKITENHAEALRDGADGWIDDVLAFRRPWRFDLSKIKQPVMLWHGTDDVFSPIGHTRWLADRIPHSIVKMVDGASHFSAMEILPRVLAWITAPDDTDRSYEMTAAAAYQRLFRWRPRTAEGRGPGAADGRR